MSQDRVSFLPQHPALEAKQTLFDWPHSSKCIPFKYPVDFKIFLTFSSYEKNVCSL